MAKNLFVGSLPYSVTDDQLGQLFSQHGQVQSVNVIKDKYTGQSRGFGFVEMSTEKDAQTAVKELDGYSLDGRNIVVKEARPKPDYNRGGDRGQRGSSNRGRGRRY